MKILSQNSTFFQALPEYFQTVYHGVEVADISDTGVTHGSKTIFVSENKTAKDLVDLVHLNGYSHIVQFNTDYFLGDLELGALVVERPEMYFSGQAQVLLRNPLKMMSIEFSKSEEKQIIFQKIEEFLMGLKPRNVHESVLAISEELFMNAVLDAPREAKAKNIAQQNDPYICGEKAKMIMVASEDRLAISCSDPYGSLDLDKFFSRLSEVYNRGAGEVMNMKVGAGAGIGCMILMENCENMFLGVIPDKLTVVSCILPLGLSYRQRAEIKKSLHLVRM